MLESLTYSQYLIMNGDAEIEPMIDVRTKDALLSLFCNELIQCDGN